MAEVLILVAGLVPVLAAPRSPQAVDRQFVVSTSNHNSAAATSRRMVCTALTDRPRTTTG